MARSVVVNFIGRSDSFRKATAESTSSLDKMQAKVTGFGRALVPALGAAAIIKFGKDSVSAFGDSEQAVAKLQNTFKNSPKLVNENIDAYQRLASAIQNKTAADDESVLAAASVLGQFDLTGKQIRDTLPLIVDYARKTGQDVPSAAEQIGKAMLGNTRALKNIGVSYKSTGDRGKDFANITDAIRQKVGGFAEREGTTAIGKLAILKNRFNDIQEVVGGKLLGVFDFMARNMNTLLPIIAALTASFLTLKVAMLVTGAASFAALGPVSLAIGGIAAVVAGLAVVIVKHFNSIKNFVMKWGPLVATLILGPFGALLTNFGGFRDKTIAIFRAVRDGIVGAFKTVRDVVVGIWNGIGGAIRTAVNGIIGIIERFLNALTVPFRKFSGLLSKVPGLGGLKGLSNEIKIPRLDSGGFVEQTGLAVVHRGETWSGIGPPSQRVGGGGQTINNIKLIVQGSVISEGDLVRKLRSELLRIGKNNVNVGLA